MKFLKQLFCRHIWQEKEEEKKLLKTRKGFAYFYSFNKIDKALFKTYTIENVCIKCNKKKYEEKEYLLGCE